MCLKVWKGTEYNKSPYLDRAVPIFIGLISMEITSRVGGEARDYELLVVHGK